MTESAPDPLRKMARIALAVLGAVVGFIVLGRMLPGGPAPRGDASAVLASPWDTTSVLGLAFQSPGRFQPITLPVPPEMRTALDWIESWGRNVGRTEMRISRMEYKPGVALSLDGSAQGAIDAMGQNRAVQSLTFAHARTQVSGVPAVRTTSRFTVEGRPAHGEILTVLRGRTLWQLQMLGPEDEAPEIARRVMDSVRIEGSDK